MSKKHGSLVQSFMLAFGFSLLLIGAYAFSQSVDQQSFVLALGIHPQHVDGLTGILTSQFGHANQSHLVMNLFPLLFLVFMIVYRRGAGNFFGIYLVTLVGSGLITWLIAPPDSMVIGISGVVAGLAGYLVVYSGVTKDLTVFGISGVLTAVIFVSIISTITDPASTSSWQAHIGGLLVGIMLAAAQLIWHQKRQVMLEKPSPSSASVSS